ncbi:6-hydroxymethylpterin diphosphokinase MptE-like protein [Paenibacillus puldeungensis]|uniref:6-hydroxymethylpterin diphosphokinase MptE-like protein n=1 Tax=Paenibacillus puldeungensis TaxID=696536 RepID=A0ABW3S257_9BACL
MDVFEKNKAFLSKHYPALIQGLETPLQDDYVYKIELTRNEEVNLLLEMNQNTYYLHSRYNAHHEAERWAKSISSRVENVDNLLLVGMGLYFLEELLAVTKAKFIYVYEPFSFIFREWMNIKLIGPILSDPRIRLFALGESDFLPMKMANDICEHMTGTFVKITPPIYEILFPGLSEKFEMLMKDTLMQQISNIQTRDLNQKTWLENIVYNLPHLINNSSISELKDLWKGQNVKAIIVGSGPSLSQDIHYLSQLKEKCLIITAGSSIQALEHFGVYPHFVVSMDGTEANFRVFKNVNGMKTPLVFCPTIYNEILEEYRGPLYYAKFQNDVITQYLFEEGEELPSFISTATVTGTAIQIAEYMGITEIILMGQDLSYPNNKYYAPGVEHVSQEVQEIHVSHSEKKVKNVDGGYNRTKGSMEVLLSDIEVLVKIMALKEVRIVNTSKGGAVIEGTEWKALDDLVPELLEGPSQDFNISKRISKKSHDIKEIQLREVSLNLNLARKEIKKLESKLVKLQEVFKKLEKAVSAYNVKRTADRLFEIDCLWKSITKMSAFDSFYYYSLGHYMNVYMRHVTKIVETEDIIEKGKLVLKHLGELTRKMQEFSPIIIATLDQGLTKLDELIIT